MKVYSRIRMGWDEKTQAYKTIESTFEEYHGEVAQCFGFVPMVAMAVGSYFATKSANKGRGGSVNVPGPSAIEQELQQEQLNILREQQARTRQMDPHVLRSMGLIQDPDITTPAQYKQGEGEIPGGVGAGMYYNALKRKTLPIPLDEEGQPMRFDDRGVRITTPREQVEISPETTTPGAIRSMTEDEWLGSMTVPEKEAYETQLAQKAQQKEQYDFQREQWQSQQDRWKRAETEEAAMKPFLLESMGLVEEDGVYRQQTEGERLAQMSTLERGQYDLTLQAQERQRKAYAGELPVSPALEASLTKQEAQITEALSRRLGTNWQLTTPGQQAMGEFSQRADLVREESRRAEISNQGGLLLGNLGYLGIGQTQQVAQRGLFSQRGQIPGVQSVQRAGGIQDFGGAYASYPQVGSSAFSGYGMLQQPYQHQKQMQLQASMQNQQSQAQRSAGMWSGLGSLAGAGMQAYGMYAGMA